MDEQADWNHSVWLQPWPLLRGQRNVIAANYSAGSGPPLHSIRLVPGYGEGVRSSLSRLAVLRSGLS